MLSFQRISEIFFCLTILLLISLCVNLYASAEDLTQTNLRLLVEFACNKFVQYGFKLVNVIGVKNVNQLSKDIGLANLRMKQRIGLYAKNVI